MGILPPPYRMFYTVILGLRVREGVKLDLIIPFKGKILSGETIGFYAFPDDADGQMAVTQFQSMNARMAYPCFDEPRSQGCLFLLENPNLHSSLCQKKLDFGFVVQRAVLGCQYKAACKFSNL